MQNGQHKLYLSIVIVRSQHARSIGSSKVPVKIIGTDIQQNHMKFGELKGIIMRIKMLQGIGNDR